MCPAGESARGLAFLRVAKAWKCFYLHKDDLSCRSAPTLEANLKANLIGDPDSRRMGPEIGSGEGERGGMDDL